MDPDDGGYDGEESLDWLWDLDGYDVGVAEATGETAAVAAAGAPAGGFKKHLRKQPMPADEFATTAFSLETTTGPVELPAFSGAGVAGPALSPMEAERIGRSRRPLMAAAVLLIIGLSTGVALAISGGGKKAHVAQGTKVAATPTTTETTVTNDTTPPPPPPPPADTTTTAATPDTVPGSPPPAPTSPPQTNRFCGRLLAFIIPDQAVTTTTTRPPPPPPPTTTTTRPPPPPTTVTTPPPPPTSPPPTSPPPPPPVTSPPPAPPSPPPVPCH